MQIDVVILPLMLLLGIAAAVIGVIYVIGHVLGSIGRGIGSLLGSPTQPESKFRTETERFRICSRARCRKMERRDATYCSQCGAPLTDSVSMTDVGHV